MSIEYQTVITCDRCGTESRYDSAIVPSGSLDSEWAKLWPQTVTPYRGQPPSASALLICAGCLTDAERELVTEMRLVDEESYPF